MGSASGARHQRHRQLVLLVAMGLSVSGCASMLHRAPDFRGTLKQDVQVTSDPTGVTVRLNGIIVGVTPTRVAVRRKEPGQSLAFHKDGYVPVQLPLRRRLSGGAFGNLALAGLAMNPLNGPNGLSDDSWSRAQQVSVALVLPAVGLGIDMMTGAAYAVPSQVHVTLVAKTGQRN